MERSHKLFNKKCIFFGKSPNQSLKYWRREPEEASN
jgi:hypothetical protein